MSGFSDNVWILNQVGRRFINIWLFFDQWWELFAGTCYMRFPGATSQCHADNACLMLVAQTLTDSQQSKPRPSAYSGILAANTLRGFGILFSGHTTLSV